jgi:DUF4097 and DUF4098 domain-containing protein YvlB
MPSHRLLPGLAAALVALAAAAPAAAARHEIPVQKSLPAPREMTLENLAGAVVVTGGSGELRVSATIHAEASTDARARALAESLEVEFDQRGDRLHVRALYPLGEHRRFCYPPSARGDDGDRVPWPLSWLVQGGSNVEYRGKRVSVTSSCSDAAPALWTDFRIEMPAGVAVTVKNAVGTIDSTGVAGDQVLDTASGDVRAERGRGKIMVDTGSGNVAITDHEGEVFADTGSGDITIERARGERIAADTGSGNVDLIDVAGSIDADTGSGDVTGRDLELGATVSADTGSGNVRLAGDFAAVRDLRIDTGSGDVTLEVAAAPSMRLTVSTGSGDIDVDLPATRIRKSRGDFVADVGSAEGTGIIDTGSGNVRVGGR